LPANRTEELSDDCNAKILVYSSALRAV